MLSDATCPCCGHRTLPERGCYEMCPVCLWEDDPEQAEQPWASGGANAVSLVEAQMAYARWGAASGEDLAKVRPARGEETRAADWRPQDPADGHVHPLYTEDQVRDSQARGEAHAAAFRSGLEALRTEADTVSADEMERKVRGLSDALDLHYTDAEVELVAHLVREDHWPRKHPLRAAAWAWRHRRSASLPARVSQLFYRPPSG